MSQNSSIKNVSKISANAFGNCLPISSVLYSIHMIHIWTRPISLRYLTQAYWCVHDEFMIECSQAVNATLITNTNKICAYKISRWQNWFRYDFITTAIGLFTKHPNTNYAPKMCTVGGAANVSNLWTLTWCKSKCYSKNGCF